MTDSRELLSDYARNGSEMAFRELVTRYIDLVFSTALRFVDGDAHRAQDVTQIVFMDLARQAAKLSENSMLGGWLHRDTCFVAVKMMRGERRRQVREMQAADMNSLNAAETRLTEIGPALDEAINELGDEDRTAILLRFYERCDLRSIGQALGSSENAAQKRVARALDQLHLMLTHRGITLSAAALGTVLTGEAVAAAPAGLAVSIAGAAWASAVGSGGVPLSVLKAMSITKLKLSLVSALAVVVLATPLIVQHQSQTRLREENQLLHRQLEQDAKLAEDNRRLSNLIAQASGSRSLAEEQMRELLRLRGEVGRLRQESKELERLREENRRLLVAQAQPAPVGGAANPPSASEPAPLYVRVFKVDAERLFSKISSASTTTNGNSNQGMLRQENLRQFFKDNGIGIEPPATVFLDERTGRVVTRASLQDLDKIEILLSRFGLPDQETSTDDAGVFAPVRPTGK